MPLGEAGGQPGTFNCQKGQDWEGCLDPGSGGSRSEGTTTEVAPGAPADFSTARWPASLEDMTLTSAAFSMASVAQAVGRSFSQVHRMDKVIPLLPFCTLLCQLEIRVGATKWVPTARNVRTSSNFICRTSRALDVVKVSL